jgi:uncharacterized protein (DUF58 family)
VTDPARPPRRAAGVGRLHPVRPLVPIGLTVAVLVGWGLVAHNSGSGWVQLLGEAVGATLVVGLVGPALAVRRARIEVLGAPGDATAGDGVEIALSATHRVRLRAVDPPGPETFAGPSRLPAAAGAVVIVPARHGVVDAVTVDVESAAPFGILWWSRRVVLALPVSLHVAPRLGAPQPVPTVPDDGTGDGARRVAAVIGEARGARPYRPGDSRQWVHWPATAHTGALMVREMEGPVRPPATVSVSLPDDPDAAERIVEEALGTVVNLLSGGVPVTLATLEPGGPVVGPVGDRRTAGRRLARAVASGGAGGGTAGESASDTAGITVSVGDRSGMRARP